MTLLRGFLLFMLVLAAATSASARPVNQSRAMMKIKALDPSGSISDIPISNRAAMRAESAGTTFFGGTFWAADSQRWEAYENQLWTFDSGVGSSIVPPGGPRDLSAPTSTWVDPHKRAGMHATMEGWIGFDNTSSTVPYFRRVGVNDPRWQTPKCVGSVAGLQGIYSFWAGVFPPEADLLCYVGGQGYGNAWNVCIEKNYAYSGGNVNLSFQFKNETEDGFDYTHVYCDTNSAGDNVEVVSYTGTVGGTANLLLLPGNELPRLPKPIKIRFCVASDGAWSDQDGLNSTACGAFAVDHILLTGAIRDTSDFEADDDGWALSEPAAGLGGELSNLYDLNDLPAPLAPCACAISDSVLALFNDYQMHNFFQDNLAASPWIDLKAYGKIGAFGKLITTHLYTDLPLRDYMFVQFNAQWYPYKCPRTGKLTTSPWTSTGFVYYFTGFPQCTSTAPGTLGTQEDFSGIISQGAEQVRIAVGVLSYCRFFGECTQVSNTTPWFDDVGLGVYGDVNLPYIHADDRGRAQDNFPTSGGLNASSPGRIDCNDLQGVVYPEMHRTLGDTLVVRGTSENAEVYVHFRVRPGPGVDMSKFNTWYSSHPASPFDATFKRARCDTAERGISGPILGFWMTSYHEADPNFAAHGADDRAIDATDIAPWGPNSRLAHDIFPDNLLTPGSRLDYFFSANYVGSSASWLDPPTAPAQPYEMEILPSSFASDNTSNCILYVDHFDRGAQPIIEQALSEILPSGSVNVEHTKWDRYDVNGAGTSDRASLGRPLGSEYGATTGQLIYSYRVILWDAGDLNYDNLSSDDEDVLKSWLTLAQFDYNNLYLSGNGIAYSRGSGSFLLQHLAGVTLRTACSAGTFRNANCPSAGSPTDNTPCVNLRPMPRPPVANSGTGRSVNHLAQGNGCPELRSFDVLDLVPPDYGMSLGDEYYWTAVKNARFASVAADASSSQTLHYRIVTDGVSVHYRRDEGTSCDFTAGGKTAVTERLREVLGYFGFANGLCPPRTTGVGPGVETPPPTLLLGVAPNPLVAGAIGRVRFSMARDAEATIEVMDLQGRRVRAVFDGPAKKGLNEATWDGRDTGGSPVGSGVYFYRFRALDLDQTRKLIVIGRRN